MANHQRTTRGQRGSALTDDEREETMIDAMACITEACVKLREAGRTGDALRFVAFIDETFNVEQQEKLAAARISARPHRHVETPVAMDENAALVYHAITILTLAGAGFVKAGEDSYVERFTNLLQETLGKEDYFRHAVQACF